ncbi:MAG: glycosyl transferase family 1 [Draconibacterium sp.]|nr:MAG: glycosyl transferase family 1 [Draconibacterium sp.]
MKITLLGPAHPFRGGIAALNERLAKQLHSEGHEVNIISFTVQYPGFLFPGKSQFSDFDASFEFPITREINSVNPLNWLKIGRKIEKTCPDIIIVRFWLPFMAMSLGTICRQIRKNKHTRVIALTDNLIPHEKRPGDRILINYFVNSVDAFIAMSASVLKDIERFDAQKPKKLTPHPIYDHYGKIEKREVALQKLNLAPEYRYILFFGFIRDYKGLDLLLKALADSFFKKNKIKLIVAGEFYTDEEKYTRLIQELGIAEQLILKTDYIPNSAVSNYFNVADIVVQPYKSATQSGVAQIAYHFNKPILVTDVGGLAEIVPHMKVGYVVLPDENKISDALKDYFADNRKTTFEKNMAEEKKRFNWDNMTKTIYSLVNETNTKI